MSTRHCSLQRLRLNENSEITQVNGKLYTIAKVQSDKSCPAVANVPPSSVVR